MRARWWLVAVPGVVIACGAEFVLESNSASGGAGGATSAATTVTQVAGTGGTSSVSSVAVTGSGGGVGGGGGSESVCSESPCKLTATQCGCEAGEKCSIDTAWNSVCSPLVPTPTPIGQPCGAGDCDAGAICLPHWGASVGVCEAFCSSNADCTAGPGSKCIWKNANTGLSNLCTTDCDPLTSTGCPAGQKCIPVFDSLDGSNVGTTCAGVDEKILGAPCSGEVFHCAAPNRCANGACRRQCVVGVGGQCPAGQGCGQFNPPANVDGTEYGACIPF